MRFVRLLTAVAALGFSGQVWAYTTLSSGTITTDATGVAVIPFTQPTTIGHLWRNKFIWLSTTPVNISVLQDYDLTIGYRGYYNTSTKPPVFVPGYNVTTHESPITNYGTGTKIIGKFTAPYSFTLFPTYQSSNYVASVIAKAGPNTSINYTLKAGAAPEPTTWAMMLIGFGAIGAAIRYRFRPARLARS